MYRLNCHLSDFSIHALLAESDKAYSNILFFALFSIHALLAESDRTGLTCGGGRNFSIHALLAESDVVGDVMGKALADFLSTLSLRRATAFFYVLLTIRQVFYPRSPCGERLVFVTLSR